MPFTLQPLPFTPDALEPHMSAETVRLHHGKHHQAYVDKTNALALEQGQSKRSLLDLIGSDIEGPLLNNAGQLWNHNFFWQCLSARQQQPEGRLADLVTGAFGTIAVLEKALVEQALAHFGSGWVWLVLDQGALKITALHDGDTPALLDDMAPLLTIDIWEHAYYLDYRNERAKYVNALLGHHINWAFVTENLDGRGLSRADQS